MKQIKKRMDAHPRCKELLGLLVMLGVVMGAAGLRLAIFLPSFV